MDVQTARTVSVDLPRRASRRLVVADMALRGVARPGLDAAVWLVDKHVIPEPVALWVLRHLDSALVAIRPPRGTATMRTDFPEFRAEWVWDPTAAQSPDSADGAVVYLHGGAFVTAGLNSHRRIVARLSSAVGLPVYNVEYRQGPDHHVTTTVADCVAAYRRVLESGIASERIVVAGDSAGGGLAFSVALAARDAGLPLPGAIVAIAPFANYDSDRRYAHPNNNTDSTLSARTLELTIGWSVERDGEIDPDWSPVNHRFDGFPPVLIQVGSREVLLDDANLLAARCSEAEVSLTFQEWERAPHVFHAAADFLPDARDAFAEIGKFVRGVLAPREAKALR